MEMRQRPGLNREDKIRNNPPYFENRTRRKACDTLPLIRSPYELVRQSFACKPKARIIELQGKSFHESAGKQRG